MLEFTEYERHKRRRPRIKLRLDFLSDARSRAGLNKVDLMRRSRVSLQTISRVEMGEPVTRPIAYRLYYALRARFAELNEPFPYAEAEMFVQ